MNPGESWILPIFAKLAPIVRGSCLALARASRYPRSLPALPPLFYSTWKCRITRYRRREEVHDGFERARLHGVENRHLFDRVKFGT